MPAVRCGHFFLRLQFRSVEKEQQMPRTEKPVVFLAAIALLASAGVNAQESSTMARCADIDNAEARLACYDEVTRRVAQPQPATEGADTEPVSTPSREEPMPLTEEVGEEQLPGKSRPEREPESFRGKVIECKQDASRKWYFYFDNGQVWKQRANARLTNRGCDFTVTITRDSFGYEMQIEGETKKLRVGRVR
jgi:hypothetical protein